MDRKLTTGPCIYQPKMVINMIMDHMMHHMTDCGHAHPVRLIYQSKDQQHDFNIGFFPDEQSSLDRGY